MAMKKVFIGERWVYIETEYADRLQIKLDGINEKTEAKIKKAMDKRRDRDHRIAREMKERDIGPNSFGNQFAGWVMSGGRQNKKESLPTIDGNPLVYSV